MLKLPLSPLISFDLLIYFREYKDLVDANVLQELTGTIQGHQDKIKGTKHYVTPAGCSSLVKHYLNKAGTGFYL